MPHKPASPASAEQCRPTPDELALIAGRGAYPLLLAESARRQGVKRLLAIAFKKETDPALAGLADEIHWLNFGQLEALLTLLRSSGITRAVMAGQITPRHLFHLRPDRRALQLLSRLHPRNADTIFGAVARELQAAGVELMPAYLFMEHAMPAPGLLGTRAPDEREQRDIALGLRVAKATSGLEIGQTVAIKDGVVLAIEAFEGTDETLLRAGRLGGPGLVAVKVARQGHDMRFDIPVVGLRTMQVLKKARASVLAVEARRTILLEKEKLARAADNSGLAFLAVDTGDRR